MTPLVLSKLHQKHMLDSLCPKFRESQRVVVTFEVKQWYLGYLSSEATNSQMEIVSCSYPKSKPEFPHAVKPEPTRLHFQLQDR